MMSAMLRPERFIHVFVAGVALWACVEDPVVTRRGGDPVGPVEDPMNTAGQSGIPGGGGAGADPITWCEAFTVLRNKCQRCHQDPTKNGAPVPLLTYEDTQIDWSISRPFSAFIFDAVSSDFMPFVGLNDSPDLEGGPVEPLTPEEKTTLLGWLEQGALPEGGTDCPP
jgi:hypothetical protein